MMLLIYIEVLCYLGSENQVIRLLRWIGTFVGPILNKLQKKRYGAYLMIFDDK